MKENLACSHAKHGQWVPPGIYRPLSYKGSQKATVGSGNDIKVLVISVSLAWHFVRSAPMSLAGENLADAIIHGILYCNVLWGI